MLPEHAFTTFFCLGSISWGHVTRAEKGKHKADSTFDVVLLMEEILHLSIVIYTYVYIYTYISSYHMFLYIRSQVVSSICIVLPFPSCFVVGFQLRPFCQVAAGQVVPPVGKVEAVGGKSEECLGSWKSGLGFPRHWA